jgi:hypothetical protein
MTDFTLLKNQKQKQQQNKNPKRNTNKATDQHKPFTSVRHQQAKL